MQIRFNPHRLRHPIHLLLAAMVALAMLVASACGGEDLEGRYHQAHADLEEMLAAVDRGQVEEAEAAFARAHPFLHEVDPPLRRVDSELARQLWDAMVLVEIVLYGERPAAPDVLEMRARQVFELFQEAGWAMGYLPDEAR